MSFLKKIARRKCENQAVKNDAPILEDKELMDILENPSDEDRDVKIDKRESKTESNTDCKPEFSKDAWKLLVRKIISEGDFTKLSVNSIVKSVAEHFQCTIDDPAEIKKFITCIIAQDVPEPPEKKLEALDDISTLIEDYKENEAKKEANEEPNQEQESKSANENPFTESLKKRKAPKEKKPKEKKKAKPRKKQETNEQVKLPKEIFYKFHNSENYVPPQLIGIKKKAKPQQRKRQEYPLSFALCDIYSVGQTNERTEAKKRAMVKPRLPYVFPTKFYLKEQFLFHPSVVSKEHRENLMKRITVFKDQNATVEAMKMMIPFTITFIRFDKDEKLNEYEPFIEANVLGVNVSQQEETGAYYNIDKTLVEGVKKMFQIANMKPPQRITVVYAKSSLVARERCGTGDVYIPFKEWAPKFFDKKSYKIIQDDKLDVVEKTVEEAPAFREYLKQKELSKFEQSETKETAEHSSSSSSDSSSSSSSSSDSESDQQ